MQLLKINATALTEKGKEQRTITAVVASTKGANALERELRERDIFVKSMNVSTLYLSQVDVENALKPIIAKAAGGNSEIEKALFAHTVKALDGACLFLRPQVK